MGELTPLPQLSPITQISRTSRDETTGYPELLICVNLCQSVTSVVKIFGFLTFVICLASSSSGVHFLKAIPFDQAD
jgi:hypothetical protein